MVTGCLVRFLASNENTVPTKKVLVTIPGVSEQVSYVDSACPSDSEEGYAKDAPNARGIRLLT